MTQANVGVGFDLIWQTDQWRQQMDAAQSELQQMAENAANMQIAIPITGVDQLTPMVDALIAEIEATRSIEIPVVMGEPGAFPDRGARFSDADAVGEDAALEMEIASAAGPRISLGGGGGSSRFGGGGMGYLLGPYMAFRAARAAEEYYEKNANIEESEFEAQNLPERSDEQRVKKYEAEIRADKQEETNETGFMPYLRDSFESGGLIHGYSHYLLKQGAIQSEIASAQTGLTNSQENEGAARFSDAVSKADEESQLGGLGGFSRQRQEVENRYQSEVSELQKSYDASRDSAEKLKEAEDSLARSREHALGTIASEERAKQEESQLRERAEAARHEQQQNEAEARSITTSLTGEVEAANLSGDKQEAARLQAQAPIYRELSRMQIENPEHPEIAGHWWQNVGRAEKDQVGDESDESFRFRRQQTLSGMEGDLSAQQAQASGDTFGAERGRNDTETRQKSLEIQEQISKLAKESGDHRSKDVQDEIDGLEKQLQITQQIGASKDAQIAKAQAQHSADIATETAAAQARAHGGGQEASLIELENSITKEIANAAPQDKEATRKLAHAQMAQFEHGEDHPFMGSMDEYTNQMQMRILSGGEATLAHAKAFDKSLDDPAQGHKDASAELKDAAKKLHDAGSAIAKAIGAGIAVMDAVF